MTLWMPKMKILVGGFVEDDLMRTAYDLGADRQLEQVIDELNKMIFEEKLFFEDSFLSSAIDCLPRRLREAMRPEEEDTP